jgi:cytochrome c553
MKRYATALLLLPAGVAFAAGLPANIDSMTERTKACTACHGAEGRAGRDAYYPRIAGKPRGYLYNQLINFREGRRQYRPMTLLLENLSDSYLEEIAGHFATLQQPYPPPERVVIGPDDNEVAQKLVNQGDPSRNLPACVACHGKSLAGVTPAIPGLLGLSRVYITAQFGAWRIGNRRAHPPDCMADITRMLSIAEVNAVAGWLAAQPVPASARPAPARDAADFPLRCGSVLAAEDRRP